MFPNPSVLSAALATVTTRIQIRAGSLISPLHDVIRVAEEWSVVDNLSKGRVAISFGSGWNIDDFVFFPERYDTRHSVMYSQINEIQRLWSGESFVRMNAAGKQVELRIYPRPVQPKLPVWITSSGNVSTYVSAGSIGANVLTHLIGQDTKALAHKIQRYRESRAATGFDPQAGKVSLMLHTFVGTDEQRVKAKVREPFREYLRLAVSLEEKAAAAGGLISGGHKIDPIDISSNMLEELLDATFERYYHNASLIGTPDKCSQMIERLIEIGVDEIACLIDFLDDHDAVIESLHHLDQLRASFLPESRAEKASESLTSFLDQLGD
jgi:natural product biosynthesis luciferase-like monooxygenase protein